MGNTLGFMQWHPWRVGTSSLPAPGLGHEVPPQMQAMGPAGQVLLLGIQGPSASTSP